MRKLIFLLFILLASCKDNSQNYNCENMNFMIQFNHTDSYNSKTNIFERSYWGRKTDVKVILSKDEIRRMNLCFKENRFLDLSDSIIAKSFFYKSPLYKSRVSYNNSCIKKVVNISFDLESKENNRKAKRVFEIINNASDIIYQKKQIRDLEPSNVYLE